MENLKVSNLRLRREIADLFIQASEEVAFLSTQIAMERSKRVLAIFNKQHTKASEEAHTVHF